MEDWAEQGIGKEDWKSDSYPHLSDIEREMAIRGTVTELVDVSRTNFNEENWISHAFPGPTCAMGWMIAWWKKIQEIMAMLTCICWSSSLGPPGLVVVGSTWAAPLYRRIASVRLVFTRMSFREVQTGITGKCRTVWIVSCGAASWRCSDPVIVY